MKTVSKIDPEKEYEIAKKMIELASNKLLEKDDLSALDSSVDNLITAARVLMEREERRRGHPKPPPSNKPKGRSPGENRGDTSKLPSARYPNLRIEEIIVGSGTASPCPCCSKKMSESGLFDVSEKLEMIPKQFYIQRIKRVKFNCSFCHGSMVNTPSVPSIVPTSNYGDSIIVDVALSKYSDLIPIERYGQMSYQSGLREGLPAQSLIGLTHHLANFLEKVYLAIKNEVLLSLVLQADETPHKMLEGDQTCNWYLWGFFSTTSCYFEIHDTRSGDVVFDFLKYSKTKIILTDGYAGYAKAVKDLKKHDGRVIDEAHCNAHAYRYFEDASITWEKEAEIFLKLYGKIYELERQRKNLPKNQDEQRHLELRQKLIPFFEEMKDQCNKSLQNVMVKSHLEKAINYFLNHYDGLTLCTKDVAIPLDNNHSERELRGPVLGRKTWYGTHSKRGAITAQVLFSIVRSCKINNVNPRHYFDWIVQRIHGKKVILTPFEYSKIIEIETS